MRYLRSVSPGGTYFFTVNLADRRLDTVVRHIGNLREAVRKVKASHPFDIVAMVVLPDHLHSVWRLPPDDADYSVRSSLIKACFSRTLASGEPVADSRNAKRGRGAWQRRYWEHQIRDDTDWNCTWTTFISIPSSMDMSNDLANGPTPRFIGTLRAGCLRTIGVSMRPTICKVAVSDALGFLRQRNLQDPAPGKRGLAISSAAYARSATTRGSGCGPRRIRGVGLCNVFPMS